MPINNTSSCPNLLIDVATYDREGIVDIGGVFGRSLQEWDAKSISKTLCGVVVNNPLCGQIALIPNQQLTDVLASISVDFLNPLLCCAEGSLLGNVLDYNDATGTAVVGRVGGAEALPSSIPNMELDGLASHLNGSDFEVNTDGALCVGIICKSEKQARLANTRATNK